jgi:hypothetical protein
MVCGVNLFLTCRDLGGISPGVEVFMAIVAGVELQSFTRLIAHDPSNIDDIRKAVKGLKQPSTL